MVVLQLPQRQAERGGRAAGAEFGPFRVSSRPNGDTLLACVAEEELSRQEEEGGQQQVVGGGWSCNLRMGPQGWVGSRGGDGPWARWAVAEAAETVADGTQQAAVTLASVGNRDKSWSLAVSRDGVLQGSTDADEFVVRRLSGGADAIAAEVARLTPTGRALPPARARAPPLAPAEFDESVHLLAPMLSRFVEEGYLHLPQLVPASRVEAALAVINSHLCSRGGGVVAEDPQDGSSKLTFCPGAGGTDEIRALLIASPLWTVVQRLLGRGAVAHGSTQSAQIALRPPELRLRRRGGETAGGQGGATRAAAAAEQLPEATPGTQWHVDGMGKGRHSPFTLLVGVALSDTSTPNSGNFVVFPGSHHRTLPLLTASARAGRQVLIGGGDQKPDMGAGHQVLARPGDVVSPYLAWIRSPCLRHCVHGAPIGDRPSQARPPRRPQRRQRDPLPGVLPRAPPAPRRAPRERGAARGPVGGVRSGRAGHREGEGGGDGGDGGDRQQQRRRHS
eukprot:COSAG01_NODE_4011_length_5436_cov_5.572232_5_plen_505_part_00